MIYQRNYLQDQGNHGEYLFLHKTFFFLLIYFIFHANNSYTPYHKIVRPSRASK